MNFLKNILLPVALKYLPILLFLPGFILYYKFPLEEEYNIQVADIIVSMLPMIFTIITIAISLQSIPIYGVSSIDFRRIRSKSTFGFLEMILITIGIFSLYFVFAVLSMTILIWTLNVISILYSILFVVQEVPVLTHSNWFLSRIVKNAWKEKNYSNFKYGNNSNDKILNDVLQNLVINNGVVSVYHLFATKDEKKNSIILDNLFSYNNEFLFDFDDNAQCLCRTGNQEYKNINAITLIDMSLDNVFYALSFNDDFNIAQIYNDSSKSYQISRMVFSLKRITDSFNMQKKYQKKMCETIQNLFMRITYSKEDKSIFEWTYNFLNGMLIYSISNNELWFLKLLRDSNYNSLFFVNDKNDYFYFISMYIYYLLKVDKRVPQIFKDELISFLNEKSEGLNSDGSNWKTIFNHKFDYSSFNDTLLILPNLLKIHGDDLMKCPWYQPKYTISWSSSDGDFSNKLLINCWLEMIIYNYKNHNYDEKKLNEVIDSLSDDEKYTLATEMNTKWFKDNTLNPSNDMGFLFMYRNKPNDSYGLHENDFINELKNIKNNIITKFINKEFDDNVKTEEDLLHYKDSLLDGFNKAIKEIDCYDESLEIDNQNYLCFDCLFDTRWTDGLIDTYNNGYVDSIKNIINEEIMTDSKIKHMIVDEKNVEFVKVIDRFNYVAGTEYKLYKCLSGESYDIIRKKSKLDLWIKSCMFVKDKGDIRINIVADDNKSFARVLNDNEINSIIDRDYKAINGLYKYCDSSDDSRSIYISRQELSGLIFKKYFYVKIVFRKEIKFNYDNIVLADSD